LANSDLHGFEKAFYVSLGPATWAQVAMVRYADDFAIVASRINLSRVDRVGPQSKARFRPTINRSKTRTVV
jgi:hypothetical protein